MKSNGRNPIESHADAGVELGFDLAYTVREIVQLDETLTAEERFVRLWRFDQLVAYGYEEVDALLLAGDRLVDLELARRLVSELGCPAAVAATILT